MTNFYMMKKVFSINGEVVHTYTDTVLIKDENAKDKRETYSGDTIADFVSKFHSYPDIMRNSTIFSKRPYLWHWDHSGERWFIDEMRECSIDTFYTPRNLIPTFGSLNDYPADAVIEYLKDRGITACPILK